MPSEPQLSIVIPTRNRAQRLVETLGTIARDPSAPVLEVIVVDDGSADATPRALGLGRWPELDLKIHQQPPRGPAAARNHGATVARAPRLLLLGDDTRPAAGTLARHLVDRDAGVQGRIDWDPRAPITRLMRFLAPAGPQFYFVGLRDGEPIPYTAVLGSNLSVPTHWLREEPFDEGFPGAALEDTEVAWRWHRRGWSVHWADEAVCWHRHHYDDLDAFLSRQRRAGRAARHAVAKHPRLFGRVIAQPVLFTLPAALRALGRFTVGRGRREDWWDLRCRLALLRGFLNG